MQPVAKEAGTSDRREADSSAVSGGPLLRPADLPRGVWQLIRWGLFCVIPVRAHVKIGFVASRVRARLKTPPPHIRENVRYVFDGLDERGVDRIVARHWEYVLRHYLMKVLPRHPRFYESGDWPVEGVEHLDAALEADRGVILAISHYGYQKLVQRVLQAHGYDVAQVTSTRIHRRYRERSRRLRQESRLQRFLHDKTFLDDHELGDDQIPAQLDVRPILAALGRNMAVAIAADGEVTNRVVHHELLGKPFPFPVGYMKLAMELDVPVLPAFAVEEGREIRVRLHPPLELEPQGDVGRNVERFVEVFEDQITRSPHLWRAFLTENYFEKGTE